MSRVKVIKKKPNPRNYFLWPAYSQRVQIVMQINTGLGDFLVRY